MADRAGDEGHDGPGGTGGKVRAALHFPAKAAGRMMPEAILKRRASGRSAVETKDGESLGSIVHQVLGNPLVALRRIVPERLLQLVEGFWALPLILILFGVGAPFALQYFGSAYIEDLFGGEPPPIDIVGARSTLQVVAGGVITIASIVFSLAFVALSITAQQLSPRILDFVVQDRATQILLGLSLATFLFSAMALSIGTEGGTVGLALSALFSLIGATGTLVMVVIFSHRMTRVMRASDMVARLGDQFVAAIRDGPASIGEEMLVDDAGAADELENVLSDGEPVLATGSGYVGPVDYRDLLAWAAKKDVLLEILMRENAFVLQRQSVARVAGAHGSAADLAEEITGFLNLTNRRVIGDTPEFEGNSLSEAALKALSPGINDPATARDCADRLFEGMAILASGPENPRALKGAKDVPRVLRARHGIAEFLEDCVAPIVEAARDRSTVRHLADLADHLGRLAERPKERAAINALKARISEKEPAPERHLRDQDWEPSAQQETTDHPVRRPRSERRRSDRADQ